MGESNFHRTIEGPRVDDGFWHHAIVVSTRQKQELWCDGQLAGDMAKRSDGERWHQDHVQVGDGCISGDAQGKPEGHCGWWPFTGQLGIVRVANGTRGTRNIAGVPRWTCWCINPRDATRRRSAESWLPRGDGLRDSA